MTRADHGKNMYDLVEEWKNSSQSQKEFSRQHQINLYTFRYWVGKYNNEQQDTPEGFLQSIDYLYNTRGWLTRINRSNLSNSNLFIDDDLNILSDEMVTRMIIDDVTLSLTEEQIGEGENIMHLSFSDDKRLVLQKVDDPNDTRIIDADEVESVEIHEANDVEYYDSFRDQGGEQYVFEFSDLYVDQYTEMSELRDQITGIVDDKLISWHVQNQETRAAICKKVSEYVFGNVGIVYFNEDNTDLFGMDILYNEGFTQLENTAVPQYDGKISGIGRPHILILKGDMDIHTRI